MHELSIVQALLEQVQDELRRAGTIGRVVRIELVIGRLSGVSVDAIRFGFQVLAPDTPLEGAELAIAQPQAASVCGACGQTTLLDELTLECPACGSRQTTITGGRELLLQSIEVEQ